jgi:hypothetical protein
LGDGIFWFFPSVYLPTLDFFQCRPNDPRLDATLSYFHEDLSRDDAASVPLPIRRLTYALEYKHNEHLKPDVGQYADCDYVFLADAHMHMTFLKISPQQLLAIS